MIHILRYTEDLENVGFTSEQAKKSVQLWVDLMDKNLATKSDFTEVQNEMKDFKTEFQSDIKDLNFELKAEFKNLRSDLDLKLSQLEHNLTIKLGIIIATGFTIISIILSPK